MKKNIFKLSALALAGTMALFSCKSTSDEVKPTNLPTAKVDFVGTDYGVLKNFNVSTTVSTTGDSAVIELTVNGTKTTDAIYITYQKDNDVAGPWKKHPDGSDIKGLKGSSFDGATTGKEFNLATNLNSFTYDVNNDVNTAFKLVIPVKLRKDATSKSDVFTLWLTTGASGSRFDNPAKNLAYGVAIVTFNYTNEALINNYSTILGNAANADLGSLFSTSSGSNYKRSEANVSGVGSTIDFLYNTPGTVYVFGSAATDAAGTIESANATNSVTAGFDVDGADNILGNSDDGFYYIKNYTKFAEVSGGTFDGVTGDASLSTAVTTGIGTSTASKLVYTAQPAGKEFVFVTAGGKKGIVKVVSANGTGTGTGATSGEASIQVKVQR
jgi:hypothetical protein